jgi:orotidine-5'-phosphate decarboxylase
MSAVTAEPSAGAAAKAAAARIWMALDTTDMARAEHLVAQTAASGVGIKLGLEFFVAQGREGVGQLAGHAAGRRLFLDLKFHDIPNTVAAAVRAAVPLQPFMLNVHAAGGPSMMRAAADAAASESAKLGLTKPLVLAVTVLTSLDVKDLGAIGVATTPADQVKRLAALAQSCGLDGVVCSAEEAAALRKLCGPDFRLVVPGIRPKGAAAGDQKRVMGPAGAIAAGADDLVIGRPITEAADPGQAVAAIVAEIAAGAH